MRQPGVRGVPAAGREAGVRGGRADAMQGVSKFGWQRRGCGYFGNGAAKGGLAEGTGGPGREGEARVHCEELQGHRAIPERPHHDRGEQEIHQDDAEKSGQPVREERLAKLS